MERATVYTTLTWDCPYCNHEHAYSSNDFECDWDEAKERDESLSEDEMLCYSCGEKVGLDEESVV